MALRSYAYCLAIVGLDRSQGGWVPGALRFRLALRLGAIARLVLALSFVAAW
ncbi:MAG: hypothetical protein HC926_02520 [Synechococcaceae cyanobacterium SM2_3_60]|nr:hypothetical protein [Synechococcaceae cyanobacterium SM2_3_60]